jgi:hypothetical protein
VGVRHDIDFEEPIMRRYRILTCGALLIAVASITSTTHGQIVPPNATYRGRTYQEWQVKYNQDLVATPVVNNRHPYLTGDVFGGQDGVLFLPGQFGAPVSNLTISPDTALFFPAAQWESSIFEPEPWHGEDEASLRANSNFHLDSHGPVFAEIDGVSVDPTPFRIETPLFEWGPLPVNNVFRAIGIDAPAGTTSPAVDVGYYLLLEPLAVGQHVINYGFVENPPGITFNITVVPDVQAGDFNADGRVDAADYVVWRKGLGTTYTQSDYILWRANFGHSASASFNPSLAPAVNPVPEPTAARFLLGAAIGALLRRPNRQNSLLLRRP